MADEKKPEETPESDLAKNIKTSLHEQVFGSDPDGGVNDTPPGAAGDRVVMMAPAIQPIGFQPMTKIGDTDRHH